MIDRKDIALGMFETHRFRADRSDTYSTDRADRTPEIATNPPVNSVEGEAGSDRDGAEMLNLPLLGRIRANSWDGPTRSVIHSRPDKNGHPNRETNPSS